MPLPYRSKTGMPEIVRALKRRFRVTRIHINSQGYDARGRYWGIGAPLYMVENTDTEGVKYVRASNAESARFKAVDEKGGWRGDRMILARFTYDTTR